MGSEMGPVGSPGTTSCRLPTVIIGISLTVFAVIRMFQTDRRTDLVWQQAALCTEMHGLPKN